jgi:hypothetical protein
MTSFYCTRKWRPPPPPRLKANVVRKTKYISPSGWLFWFIIVNRE